MNKSRERDKILIFPAGMPRSIEFQHRCEREGIATIGASSVINDPAKSLYREWRSLPYVVAPDFVSALAALAADDEITGIFSPNLVVWNLLAEQLPQLGLNLVLVNGSPAEAEIAPYLAAQARAKRAADNPLQIAANRVAAEGATLADLSAIYRSVDTVPGMCDHDKMDALCEVLRYVPSGDVVEIGSWWGKSAVLLRLLSQQYKVGALLCVDPWQDVHLLQADSKVVDETAKKISADTAFHVFVMNLLPIAQGHANYLRMPSVNASTVYRATSEVVSAEFGVTTYRGEIALLHIDGNHDYDAVKADIESWGSMVCRHGGWIVFDDYVWAFGDGPKRVADEFLQAGALSIACAFVMGTALFVQLGADA